MTHEITEEGVFVDGTRVFAALDQGNLLLMVRSTSKAKSDAMALEVGLKRHKFPAQPAVVDPITGEVTKEAVEAHGPLVASPGVTIAEEQPEKADSKSAPMPRIELVPGEYDEKGNEITPPVFSSFYHSNYWLAPWLVKRGLWEAPALEWTLKGIKGESNSHEDVLVHLDIGLIDPATVKTKSNRLL